MPTPTNRTPVRVARGTYSNLNTNKADIQEGEICYATDQDKLYVKEGSNLVDATNTDISSKANIASPTFTGTVTIPAGASISGYAATGTAQSFTALQTMNAGLTVDGSYKQTAEAVSALDIDLSTGNYFTKTISGNSTFTFSSPPASGTVGSFTLELTHTSGTVTWPASVKWPADTAPTLTTGKTHLFVFVTDDGGTRYRGAALADYVN